MTVDPVASAWIPVEARDCGVTYRQIDYWARRGWVRPVQAGSGSGVPRRWPEVELRVLRIMGRLVRAGITPERAAGIARHAIGAGPDDSLSIVNVTPDVTVIVANA